MSDVKLGLCYSRPEMPFPSQARSSLENAVQFFQIGRSGTDGAPVVDREGPPLTLARFHSSPLDLERSLREAVENDVTHVLFLSPRTLFPFYSLETLLEMGVGAVSGVSWTWMVGPAAPPLVFPRFGYFDPEGRPYPYFGWHAPDLFEVEWCGLDCLILSREAVERTSRVLERVQGSEPALRISHCLRSLRIPILIDSSIQCPRAVIQPPRRTRAGGAPEPGRPNFVPSPATWREFSRDNPERRLPRGKLYDPAYRGREWYRDWAASVAVS